MWISPKLAAYRRMRRRAAINVVDELEDLPGGELSQVSKMPAGEESQGQGALHEDAIRTASDHAGSAMLAIYPTPDAASSIANSFNDLDIKQDELHVTLIYLGKNLTEEQFETIEQVVSSVAAAHPALECKLQGLGMFDHEDDDGRPFYASINAMGLGALRADLFNSLNEAGIEVPSEYDFVPHMTLGYVNPNDPDFSAGSPGVEWTSATIELVHGDNHVASFELGSDHVMQDKTAQTISIPNESRMMSLDNADENTHEDPDLKLGSSEKESEVEQPYSSGHGPLAIEITDRYGGAYPDPETVCKGQCEGMGFYPEKRGNDYEFVDCEECDGTGLAVRS